MAKAPAIRSVVYSAWIVEPVVASEPPACQDQSATSRWGPQVTAADAVCGRVSIASATTSGTPNRVGSRRIVPTTLSTVDAFRPEPGARTGRTRGASVPRMGEASEGRRRNERGDAERSDGRSIRALHRVDPGTPFLLSEFDPASTPGMDDESRARGETPETGDALAELQERLWVEGERSLLVVLQGMDTSGKGGTVEHVFQGLNPAGVDVTSFKQPTPEERRHHYLWRVRRRLPEPGSIMIFDRSHYEDVLVVRVERLVPDEVWFKRYPEIRRFEAEVAAHGTTILKFFLAISYDEQRERLLARLEDPLKRWKFREGDLETRARWPEYVAAYEDAIRACSTEAAPWFVIPADHKWYRNWAVARIVLETLRDMDPRIPVPDLDVDDLERRLAPPN